jgi:hypothetical protein
MEVIKSNLKLGTSVNIYRCVHIIAQMGDSCKL